MEDSSNHIHQHQITNFDINNIYSFDTTYEEDEATSSRLIDNLGAILLEITSTINQLYPAIDEVFEYRKDEIIKRIETIMVNLAEAIRKNETPAITLKIRNKWKNCIMVNDRLTLKPLDEINNYEMKMDSSRTKLRFPLIIWILSYIHKLLLTNTVCTRRELYYQNINFVKNQRHIDRIIVTISNILQTPSWELNIISTSKGLVSGDIQLFGDEGFYLDCCKTKGGVLIPQHISKIQQIVSTAQFILVVEKDTIFQKLLIEGLLETFKNCILITGKGFPDINTRLFLKRLWVTLKIPIFIMTDADPWGIDIMCTYRFGSLASAQFSEHFAIPAAKWIGIHPSDIKRLNITALPLTEKDKKKLREMLKRPYMNELLQRQLNFLLETEEKAEIEAVATLGYAYLTKVYLPNKISSLEII